MHIGLTGQVLTTHGELGHVEFAVLSIIHYELNSAAALSLTTMRQTIAAGLMLSHEIKAATTYHRINSMSKQKILRSMIDTFGKPIMFASAFF